MTKLINPCFTYTSLWCLYFCQGILYPSGSVISQGLAFIIFILSLIYTVKYLLSQHLSGYQLALFSVLTLVTIYGCVAFITDGTVIKGQSYDTSLFAWFKNLYLSILPIFTYLYFAKNEYLSKQFVIKMLPMILVSVLVSYYWAYNSANQLMLMNNAVESDGVTNNAGYLIVSIIPLFLVIDKNKLLQYTLLLLSMMLIVFAMKRGAILIGTILTILFLLRNFKQASFRFKIIIILLNIGLFYIIYYFIDNYMLSNQYFLGRVEEVVSGKSSGRDNIYSTLWQYFNHNADFFSKLFGGGVWFTTKICYTSAHNDWFEFLLDMGLLGVTIYLYYWISFSKLLIKKDLPGPSVFCLTLIFINLFMKTLFSMSLDTMTYIQGMMIGLSYYGLLKK